MKKFLALSLVIAMLVVFAPAASAKDWSNPAKNVGNILVSPFKLVAKATVNVIDTATFQKPLAVFSIPKESRQVFSDAVETTVYRLPLNATAIEKDELGAVSGAIDEAGLNWLADGVFYGVATGCFTHEGVHASHVHHYLLPLKAGLWAGGGAAVSSAISDSQK